MKFKENSSEEKEELKVKVEVEQENKTEAEKPEKPKLSGKEAILAPLVEIVKIRINVINNSTKEIESVLKEMEDLLNEGNC